MASLKEVETRINLITATQQITKAMKMIAAAKLHKVQQLLIPLKEYTNHYNHLLHIALEAVEEQTLSFPWPRKRNVSSKRILLVVVTSDQGLCGSFNKHLLKVVSNRMEEFQQIPNTFLEVLVIGKKAYQFFSKLKITLISRYVNLFEKPYLQASSILTDYCIQHFQKGYYSDILLVYNSFKNVSKQEVTIKPFLPFLLKKKDVSLSSSSPLIPYIYEPSPLLFLEQLIPEILKNQITHMLVESSASEHAARMVTMSQATDNAEELLKALRIHYNRTRQTLITNSLAEIIGSVEALADQ